MTRVAITGALLLDGTGVDLLSNQTVIWEQDRITWVGPDVDANLQHAFIVPAEGGTVLPGLIDSHVHVTLDPTPTGVEDVAVEPVARTAIRAAQAARTLLDSGITSARDVGSRDGVAIEVARAQADGTIQGTRLLAAGRGITPPGGHGITIGVGARGPAEVARAAADEIAAGADLIKLFPTGGVLGPGAHGFAVTQDADEMAAAVEVAHEAGVKVAAHVHGPEGVELALAAGVDTIEHGTGATRDQVEEMRDRGVALVPTLLAVRLMIENGHELPDDLLDRAHEVRSVQEESTHAAIDVGTRVLPGTDSGTPFNPPGLLAGEIEILAELGMGAAEAIRAATALAAETFGLDDLGIVERDRVADLILVDGDPLEDLETLYTPVSVVQNGVMR